jgi:hypothetical protein
LRRCCHNNVKRPFHDPLRQVERLTITGS